ncbi:MAG: kfoC [Devosia sp.]|nr:kfoC [Devosia sp.]
MLSLILPVRNWPLERVQACLASFVALGSDKLSEILVIDFGSDEPIVLEASDPMIRLIRLEAQLWSLAEAINAGVLLARNELIAKTDADILIGPASRAEFDRMVSDLEARRFGLGVVQATDLHESLDTPAALAAVLAGQEPLGRLRPKWGQGGLVFFSKLLWDQIGGFDSRFTGWGNEDNDFAERVRRAGHRIGWAERDALQIFHVWHPPSYAATGVISQRLRNQKIAKDDKSVLRPVAFRHSNFEALSAPALRRASPLVTLGIATTGRLNRNRMIREAINSFKGQIDQDFEILVVDNGSTPEDVADLKTNLDAIRWTDQLRLETTEQPSIPAARNMISQLARGRYICVVDDDDIAFSNRLADHLKVMQGDGLLHGSHGGWIDFDQSTGVIERNGGKHRTPATLLRGSGKITAHPASFYRTDVLRAVPYDEAFALGSDLDLALRLATLGFSVGHTNTYVTLRRYHSTNVTITGQSNQVSNGATARSRALATYAWQKIEALTDLAKANDKEAYCRNQLAIDSLAELIPGYTGQWQIYVPISALTSAARAPVEPERAPFPAEPALIEVDYSAGRSQQMAVGQAPSTALAQLNSTLLEAVLAIAPGDICTKHSGLNQPIYFRSEPISGLRKARRAKSAIEELIKLPSQLNSVRQGELDREVPFAWNALEIKPGERVLKSEEYGDLSSLLMSLARVEARSLMGQTLSIVSDFGDEGQTYFLVSPPIKGYEEVQSIKFTLERRTGMAFHQVATNGVPSELTLSSRAH